MNTPSRIKAALVTAALFLAPASAVLLTSTTAQARGYSNMSCDELWYERNAIYADAGYCFKTRRARRTFGRACFPPYGRLSRSEQRRVARIQRAEGRQGCD